MKVKGSLNVAKDLVVGESLVVTNRIDSGFAVVNQAGGDYSLVAEAKDWINFTGTAATTTLPDATGLANGWSVVILNSQVGNLIIRDNSTATLKSVLPSRAYKVTLVDNGTAAGTWYINFLEEADLLPAARYTDAFNATTDWTSNGSYYEITYLEGTHDKGVNPMVEVMEDIGGGIYEEVLMDYIKINASGDVIIGVSATPDARFAGLILIS